MTVRWVNATRVGTRRHIRANLRDKSKKIQGFDVRESFLTSWVVQECSPFAHARFHPVLVGSKLGIFVIILFWDRNVTQLRFWRSPKSLSKMEVRKLIDICDTNQSHKIQKQVLGWVLDLCHTGRLSALYSISLK